MDNRLIKTYGSEDLIYDVSKSPSMLQWVTPNSRVLEFGPAMGNMTRFMKENLNCRVTAIEINPEMAKHTEKYAEKIIIANLDVDDWSKELEGTFEFLLFADVLEHLQDPQSVLQKAVTFLSEGGNVLTSIPNIAHSSVILSLMDGEFEYQKYGLLDNTHIHFFTRKSIREMMNVCGLHSISQVDFLMRPGSTELKKFYTNHISAIFSVLRKKDSSVYQFVNKWSLKEKIDVKPNFNPYTLSIIKSILVLIDDLNDYFGFRFHCKLSLPKKLKKIIRNG